MRRDRIRKSDHPGAGARRAHALLVATAIGLAGCAGGSGGGAGGWLGNLFSFDTVEKRPIEDYSAEEIFKRGQYEADHKNYKDAAHWFGEVERLYPYSELARRALVMQAYAYHKAKQYDDARAAAQRFLDFYPGDADAAYAQYLLALSYYDQIDDIGRDQGQTYQALQALRKVIEKYPDTEYARSAILKFDLAFDHLAGKEMEVGRYYLKRKHYTAAINRFRVVVEQFQTTSHTPEALHRLVEAYLSLGLTDEAQAAGAILGHNFQASDWYQASYALLKKNGLEPTAKGDNWLTKIYRQMIKGEWL
ncbi:MAG: outer membrane protein assembly factor BamD [Alphaproteobacteria bacterium]|nr:MAG: outer membrane protein assembly factor BamD [Alphaproteobacteria bacterium]